MDGIGELRRRQALLASCISYSTLQRPTCGICCSVWHFMRVVDKLANSQDAPKHSSVLDMLVCRDGDYCISSGIPTNSFLWHSV